MKKKPLITAHSGCDNTPDNSLEFVEYALKLGVDAIEIDVRKFMDCLIIRHDPPKQSDIGNELFVKLEDVFVHANANPKIAINCDLKDEGIEEEVLRLAVKCKLQNPIIFSGSVSLDTIKSFEEEKSTNLHLGNENFLCKYQETYLNIENMLNNFYIERYKNKDANQFVITNEEIKQIVSTMKNCGATVLNLSYKFACKELIDSLKKEGISLSIWTLNEEVELMQYMDFDVTNITTRNPICALNIRDKHI